MQLTLIVLYTVSFSYCFIVRRIKGTIKEFYVQRLMTGDNVSDEVCWSERSGTKNVSVDNDLSSCETKGQHLSFYSRLSFLVYSMSQRKGSCLPKGLTGKRELKMEEISNDTLKNSPFHLYL